MPQFLEGVLSSPSVLFEPQRTNAGIIRFNDIGTFGGTTDQLLLKVASFNLPRNRTDQTLAFFLNEQRKFAGRTYFEDIQVEFYDYVDRFTIEVLKNWRYTVHNPFTGAKSPKYKYAKNGEIELFGPTLNNSLESSGTGNAESSGNNYIYQLIGVWPMDLDPGAIDYQGDDLQRIRVSFSIDKVKMSKAG